MIIVIRFVDECIGFTDAYDDDDLKLVTRQF